MSAKYHIGLSEFGAVGDNFGNVDLLASIDVSYNPSSNQTTYRTQNTTERKVTNIHRNKCHIKRHQNRCNGPELIGLVRRCIRLFIEKQHNKKTRYFTNGLTMSYS